VQAFDMEVVRDTKDVAFRFSLSAALMTLAALAVGGIALAAGLAAFQEEGTASAGGGGEEVTGPFAGSVVAQGTRFRTKSFELPPNTEVTLVMDNRDRGIPHNIAFFNSDTAGQGGLLQGCTAGCQGANVQTPVENGAVKQSFTFKTPGAGTYAFHCDIHPTTMNGKVTVVEGAPIPGQAPSPAAGTTGTAGAGTPTAAASGSATPARTATPAR
jgi:plastocyanin